MKTNNIDKFQARQLRKTEKTGINSIRNERRAITADHADIRKRTRKYCDQL